MAQQNPAQSLAQAGGFGGSGTVGKLTESGIVNQGSSRSVASLVFFGDFDAVETVLDEDVLSNLEWDPCGLGLRPSTPALRVKTPTRGTGVATEQPAALVSRLDPTLSVRNVKMTGGKTKTAIVGPGPPGIVKLAEGSSGGGTRIAPDTKVSKEVKSGPARKKEKRVVANPVAKQVGKKVRFAEEQMPVASAPSAVKQVEEVKGLTTHDQIQPVGVQPDPSLLPPALPPRQYAAHAAAGASTSPIYSTIPVTDPAQAVVDVSPPTVATTAPVAVAPAQAVAVVAAPVVATPAQAVVSTPTPSVVLATATTAGTTGSSIALDASKEEQRGRLLWSKLRVTDVVGAQRLRLLHIQARPPTDMAPAGPLFTMMKEWETVWTSVIYFQKVKVIGVDAVTAYALGNMARACNIEMEFSATVPSWSSECLWTADDIVSCRDDFAVVLGGPLSDVELPVLVGLVLVLNPNSVAGVANGVVWAVDPGGGSVRLTSLTHTAMHQGPRRPVPQGASFHFQHHGVQWWAVGGVGRVRQFPTMRGAQYTWEEVSIEKPVSTFDVLSGIKVPTTRKVLYSTGIEGVLPKRLFKTHRSLAMQQLRDHVIKVIGSDPVLQSESDRVGLNYYALLVAAAERRILGANVSLVIASEAADSIDVSGHNSASHRRVAVNQAIMEYGQWTLRWWHCSPPVVLRVFLFFLLLTVVTIGTIVVRDRVGKNEDSSKLFYWLLLPTAVTCFSYPAWLVWRQLRLRIVERDPGPL